MAKRKSNKTTYKTGVTHGGRFHTDDVLSTALLRALFPKLKVMRPVKFDAAAVPKRAGNPLPTTEKKGAFAPKVLPLFKG